MRSSTKLPISDSDSDDKLRRRRRRWHVRRWIRRSLVRWWPLLIFLPAVALLASEGLGIVRKERDIVEVGGEVVEVEKGNLDRVDPVMRRVGGGRERCLKLLPPDELELLQLPPAAENNFPIKKLLYRFETEKAGSEANATLLQKHMEGTRFNLFTGIQTLQEREESFKVRHTVKVHCGFYSENGGFRISNEDKSYMQSCDVVVSTCAFGGGDDLYQPIGMTDASLRKVCYVAFWDEITRSAQVAEGKKINDRHKIGKWRIVIVHDLPFTDQRLNGKIPKILSHRLFPKARYSIWVDSKSQFRRDPLGVLEALLWRTNSVFAISEHGARSSVYDEGKAIVKKHKATPEEVDIQLSHYKQDGFADIKRFNGMKALSEASVIVREHTPRTNLLMCVWFNEVVRFTSRDQLSFPYVLRRLNIPGINMFPVCTRKDLVNSMGHKRKVKPLVI